MRMIASANGELEDVDQGLQDVWNVSIGHDITATQMPRAKSRPGIAEHSFPPVIVWDPRYTYEIPPFFSDT